MVLQSETKLKRLLDHLPAGHLIDTRALERHGITRQLARSYVLSGWLESVAHGLFRRLSQGDEDLDWRLVVRSLQHVMGYASVVGGRTALDASGYGHYLKVTGPPPLHLYGAKHPTWLSRLEMDAKLHLHSAKLFGDSVDDTEPLSTPFGDVIASTPERAVLELLDELPNHETFHLVDTVFESLASARPRRFEKLLSACKSIKVKRLFFVFADRHNHAWRKHLDPDQFDLGRGPRALVKGGAIHPRYKISVPKVFAASMDTSDAA